MSDNIFDDEKLVVKRVTDYGKKPRSARQALIQAHAFLAEEGQWIKDEFFRDGDAQEAYEKAACNSWSACAMGALGLVTGEMPVKVRREWYRRDALYEWQDAVANETTELGFLDWANEQTRSGEFHFVYHQDFGSVETPLSSKAAVQIARVLNQDEGYQGEFEDEAISDVITFNDGSSRTHVLDVFAQAIRNAGGTPLVDHNKPAKKVRKR